MNPPQRPSPDQFPQPGTQPSPTQIPPPPAPPSPGFQQPAGQLFSQSSPFPVPPANPLQQSGSPLLNQPLQAQIPPPQQSTGQPPAQEGPAPFQPAGSTNDPSWLKILLVFGGGFAVTILPLFFRLRALHNPVRIRY